MAGQEEKIKIMFDGKEVVDGYGLLTRKQKELIEQLGAVGNASKNANKEMKDGAAGASSSIGNIANGLKGWMTGLLGISSVWAVINAAIEKTNERIKAAQESSAQFNQTLAATGNLLNAQNFKPVMEAAQKAYGQAEGAKVFGAAMQAYDTMRPNAKPGEVSDDVTRAIQVSRKTGLDPAKMAGIFGATREAGFTGKRQEEIAAFMSAEGVSPEDMKIAASIARDKGLGGSQVLAAMVGMERSGAPAKSFVSAMSGLEEARGETTKIKGAGGREATVAKFPAIKRSGMTGAQLTFGYLKGDLPDDLKREVEKALGAETAGKLGAVASIGKVGEAQALIEDENSVRVGTMQARRRQDPLQVIADAKQAREYQKLKSKEAKTIEAAKIQEDIESQYGALNWMNPTETIPKAGLLLAGQIAPTARAGRAPSDERQMEDAGAALARAVKRGDLAAANAIVDSLGSDLMFQTKAVQNSPAAMAYFKNPANAPAARAGGGFGGASGTTPPGGISQAFYGAGVAAGIYGPPANPKMTIAIQSQPGASPTAIVNP